MEEDIKRSLEELSERDRERLKELKARMDAGTLSYTEKIELELLESQERTERKLDTKVIKEEERSEYERLKREVLGRSEKKEEEMVEFETLPADFVEEPRPAPGPKVDVDPEKVKMSIAFGAGALMGYLLKDLLEDEFGEDDD